jgi:hypothetical protein
MNNLKSTKSVVSQEQRVAINHQLHLQTISTLTELLKASSPELRVKVELAISELLAPFIPTTNIIS